MEDKNKDTKEKIIDSAFQIMEKEGVENITIRKIADQAQVNVAAINYHFGIKENIVNMVFKFISKQIDKTFSTLQDKSKPPKERLESFCKTYTDNLLTHHGVVRSIITQIISQKKPNPVLIETLKKNLALVQQTIAEGVGNKQPEVDIAVFQVMSSLIFPMITYRNPIQLSFLDYRDKKIRDKYIEILVERIFQK